MTMTGFFGALVDAHTRMVQRRIGALRQQSRLMVGVITLFVIGYWVAGYALFRAGFWYLTKFPGLGGLLMDRMLYLFFAFLFMMLIFSNMIIGYSTLFKSQETQWMMTLPVRHTDVFRWKLLETALLASWAFMFLSAPFLLAYGSVRDVSAVFYFKAVLLFLPFLVIPAALGLIIILLVTRYLHRQFFKWALFGLGTLAVMGAVLLVRPMDAAQLQQAEMISSMNQLLHNSRLALQPLLPSYWVASSMIAWGEGWGGRGLFFFLVLVSNALMAMLVCVVLSVRLFYDGWSRNHSQGPLRFGVDLLDREFNFRANGGTLDRVLRCWPWLHPSTRALMVKDVRVFWRDTSQWSQFVIFFGLLGLYVLNLRNVSYDWNNEFWASFVSFLNLGASSMTLATLTTRFVFPQFSMEGKRLWIVGMVPYGMKRVLLEKFWLSSAWSVVITLTLTLLSSWMLKLPAWMTVLFSATVVLMSFALCGIAVGIGALFPNFGTGSTANRYDNPAKIVSGFGGTFCFVLSLVYIVLVIAAEALPVYFGLGVGSGRPWGVVVSWIFVSLLSLAAIVIPMSLALKKVGEMEM